MSGPYRELGVPTRPCPRCGFALVPQSVLDARLESCPGCDGIFVGRPLIPRLLDPLDLGGEVLATFPPGLPSTAVHGPMYVKCPHCLVVMNRRQFATGAKVVVDICRIHGIWFDADELRAVAAFAEAGGMERAAAIEERRREQQRAEAARDQAAQKQAAAMHVPSRSDQYSTFLDWLVKLFV